MNIRELQDLIDLSVMLGVEEVFIIKPGRDGSPEEYKDFTITGIRENSPGRGDTPTLGIMEKF